MKSLYTCNNDHHFLGEFGKFGQTHDGCGARITGSQPIHDESQIFYCTICGEPAIATYSEPTKSQMLSNKLCFYCVFWAEKIEWRRAGNPKAIVINGQHNMVEPDEPGDRRWSGCGGQEFVIETFDGRRIVTHNLWHQGVIPERFRSILTDNVKFVQETKPLI